MNGDELDCLKYMLTDYNNLIYNILIGKEVVDSNIIDGVEYIVIDSTKSYPKSRLALKEVARLPAAPTTRVR